MKVPKKAEEPQPYAEYVTNVTKNGNSLYVKIPNHVRKKYPISENDDVKVRIEKVD